MSYIGSKRSSSLVSATEITLDGAKLKSSGDSITKSDGTTAVLSESSGTVTFTTNNAIIEGSSSGDLVRITQTGSGNALVVEDSANPDSTPFIVDSSGNVGIGTSSPATLLHIESTASSNIKVKNTGDTGTNINYDANRSNASGWIGSHVFKWNGTTVAQISGATGTSTINKNDGQILFYTVSSGSSLAEVMRIDSSGNVIIGNNGVFSETAVNVRLSKSLGQIYCASNNADAGIFYRPTSNTGAGVILTKSNVGGNNTLVGAGYANGSFAPVSDATKKKNITDARSYLDDIKRIRVVKYNWITDEEDAPKEIGWIAQEVEEIFPGMVDTKEGSKLLKKEVFLPMLMKCLQEQQTLIESQQSQIDALTTKTQEQDLTIASLISRIEALETQPT